MLVVAGAGTGKTRTLVERCLARVLAAERPVSLERVLMVTFTEAAAAEMRRRIGHRLQAEVARQPERDWLSEQAALVDTAHIGTLHSFCLRLAREHFHELGLDPQIIVLAEAQGKVLAAETLDRLLERHYAGKTAPDQAVQDLVLAYGGSQDDLVRGLIRRVHNYRQTLPDPEAWLDAQRSQLRQPHPAPWLDWLTVGLGAWREDWAGRLGEIQGDNPNADRCRAALAALPVDITRAAAATTLERILAADADWPPRRKTVGREPLEKLFDQAAFLAELVTFPAGAKDPLQEDWDWVRPHVLTLLDLAAEFTGEFTRAKHELGAVDFHDLEQLALRLLWDKATGQPTPLAASWRQRLDLVLVDEYQDINAAQDRILQALSRAGPQANRFLVGDVKQSIYRFRLANPRIFQGYHAQWRQPGAEGEVVPLVENFRSHEGILRFVNAVFEALMQPAVGGVAYDDEARLRFGDPEHRPHHTCQRARPSPASAPLTAPAAVEGNGAPSARVELHLLLGGAQSADPGDAPAEADVLADFTGAEKEALVVGRRLRALKEGGFPVWDAAEQRQRPVQWSDMVVLLRAPKNKVEGFAKVFHQLGLPLVAARCGLFAASEVSDLLSLLTLLDNPFQDIPLLAVLRSPLVGLEVAELVVVRLARGRGRFWTALRQFHAAGTPPGEATAWVKVDEFLRRYDRWRDLARREALSHCLETVLEETGYGDWLLTQDRGAQRNANVQRLVAHTREFDQFQRQGLFRFLRFVEAQQAAEFDPEPAVVAAGDAVRLMSIHQSKGLEFPVVVLAGLGKQFNLRDLMGAIILDEDYGPCPLVRPAPGGPAYQSLPYWLAQQRQRREILGEELRLLYVAMTRPTDLLILSGTAARRAAERDWQGADAALSAPQLVTANDPLDWLGPLLPRLTGQADWLGVAAGEGPLLAWRLWDPATLEAPLPRAGAEATTPFLPSPDTLLALRARLAWAYPHGAATLEAAKTTVTLLRRRGAAVAEAEARRLFPLQADVARRRNRTGRIDLTHYIGRPEAEPPLTPEEIGSAHHRFLQLAPLDQVGSETELRAAAERLAALGQLRRAEVAALDWAALLRFWLSPLGQALCARAQSVRRELPFTARFTPAELAARGIPVAPGLPPDEFIVVQGVADLVLLEADALWVVDFKTDRLMPRDSSRLLREYAAQLALYTMALARIHPRTDLRAFLHFFRFNRTLALELRAPATGA